MSKKQSISPSEQEVMPEDETAALLRDWLDQRSRRTLSPEVQAKRAPLLLALFEPETPDPH